MCWNKFIFMLIQTFSGLDYCVCSTLNCMAPHRGFFYFFSPSSLEEWTVTAWHIYAVLNKLCGCQFKINQVHRSLEDAPLLSLCWSFKKCSVLVSGRHLLRWTERSPRLMVSLAEADILLGKPINVLLDRDGFPIHGRNQFLNYSFY